jgi:hypothetical protein
MPEAPLPPGPAVATGLARDAGVSNLTVTGAMRAFAGASDAAAKQARLTKRTIDETDTNSNIWARDITTHEPASQDSLADMIRAVNARRRRLTP